jgi:glycine betaine catabolism B
LKPGDKIIASRLAGDFVLPKSKDKKLVFIAGGIGITPFRSMIKHLLDINEKRDIILLYSNFKPADIVYKDIFDQSEKQLGIKTIYTVTDKPCPKDWVGENCFIDEDLIQKTVMDYRERTFYLSGSHNMAAAMDKILRKMGIPKQQIKKDFFLGLA